MTFTLAVALYAGFVIWGRPVDGLAEASTEAAPIETAAVDYDRPTILSVDAAEPAVTRAFVAPDPAVVAASAPAPTADFGRLRDIGEPLVVSLVDPGAPAPDAEAETTQPAGGPFLVVTGTVVNMRSGPSTANPVVDSLAEGTLTEPLGAPVDGWQEIRDVSTGLTGYMAARFLSPS
ncbi:SH3 domain-containing protein [Jannaschia ovalis]|uniref:SH3 domain-containing protein n=1 Tax=Jannaschia ovalis TaxID=3038773 RepID=A0ABY8LFL5_9RHOB|nr:SH3 domain-containing protein [Jannaschia sp. GRR-S6-38]WGH79188.1 SH3 domain-containing protein [Jannaschia sp. GRR-S6-38]